MNIEEKLKWNHIRNKRNELLAIFVDPFLPYIICGDLPLDQVESIKRTRKQLLDLPKTIQEKIDAGELGSVLDYRINTRELLGLPKKQELAAIKKQAESVE